MNKKVVDRTKEIFLFFHANQATAEMALLWETFKVYICGILISQKNYLKNKKTSIVRVKLWEDKKFRKFTKHYSFT